MSIKKIRLFFLFSLFFFHFSFVSALDFGMFLNQNAGYGGAGKDGSFDYKIGAVPRLTGLLGQTGDFIISAGIEADYNDSWKFVPELLRTELSFHSGEWVFEFGRMYHSDPLGFAAEGLFDGVKVAYNSQAGTFSAGAWYTGLLYKKRTAIEMTDEETMANNAPLDYGNFAGTYFAPKRFLGALGWEHLGGVVQARASVLGQFDFFAEKPLNSQYAVVKLTLPVKIFSFDLGGCFELLQNDGETGTALAASAGIAVTPQTVFKNRLSLLARYFSGAGNGNTGVTAGAFTPFTSQSRWNIFKVKFSGLSIITLDYAARLHPAFSAGLSSAYYIRNDFETYKGYPLSGETGKGYALGNEFFARLLWSPSSDLHANLGAGVFLPSMGDAAPNADNFWRVELNIVFSLF
ncbi:MAG: hypothetical protein LBV17_04755 [Treponema sp.]|jgi:hypothetical protein|nr:hypothetical protein [Treponema sp.]